MQLQCFKNDSRQLHLRSDWLYLVTRMSTHDALLALKNAVKSKATITYLNGSEPSTSLATATHIVLGPSESLLKTAPTRLRKPGTSSADPALHPQDFYTLHAVYLAWLLRDAHGAEYLKQMRENGLPVGFISITDRKNVVDWLEGKVSDLENIAPVASECCVIKPYTNAHGYPVAAESTTPPGSPPPGTSSTFPSTPATSRLPDSATSPSKRRYVPDNADADAVKKIKLGEIELRDRNAVLRGIKANVRDKPFAYSFGLIAYIYCRTSRTSEICSRTN